MNKYALACFATIFLCTALTPAAARHDRDKNTCVRGDGDEKIAACTRVIDRGERESRPERSAAYVARARTISDRGDYDIAIRDLDEAIALDPKNVVAANNRGYNFAQKGDYDRAIRDYDEALRINPKFATALSNRADVWRMKGSYDRAINDLDAAAQINPKTAVVYFIRAQVYSEKGDYDRALRDCDEAIHLVPGESSYYARRGDVYLLMNNSERALRDYDEAVRLNPRNWYANFARARTLFEKGENDRAMRDLDEALRLNPRAAIAFNQRGFMFRMSGEYDRAIRDLDEAIRLSPKLAVAYSNRGDVWRRKGDMTRAIADISEAVRLDPRITPAYVVRGQAFEALGNVEKARADFETALKMPPGKFTTTKDALQTARDRLAALDASSGSGPLPAITPAPRSEAAVPIPARPASATERGPRVALVIGNAAYSNVPSLANPVNDAREMSNALRELGFKVIEGYNLTSTTMRSKIAEFGSALPGAGVSLFYYAGHGMQVAGRNYLVPVDAKVERPSALGTEALEVTTVISDMESEKRINLVFLDACRDNPLARNLARSMGSASRSSAVGQGLAQVNAGIGTLITFATSPDTIALDGSGRNSPFTQAMLKYMATPGLEIRAMLTRVRADVIRATNEQQVPWDHSSLTGDFYFKPGS